MIPMILATILVTFPALASGYDKKDCVELEEKGEKITIKVLDKQQPKNSTEMLYLIQVYDTKAKAFHPRPTVISEKAFKVFKNKKVECPAG